MKKYIVPFAACLSALMLLPIIVDAGREWKDNPGKGNAYGRECLESIDLNNDRLEVGRALIEVQSSNWPSILPYYTDDIEYHDPIVDINGIEDMAEFLARLFISSSNLVTTVEDENCIDGVYMSAWTMVGDFNGVPYSAKGMSTIKFVPGETLVYYQRDYYTEGDIMVNIPGLDEAILGFRTYYKCAVDPAFPCPLPPPE
jgi:hypothetical protein